MKYFFSFLLLLVVSFTVIQTQETYYVWKGWDHDWQRKLLEEFETPHRMGSIANYVLSSENKTGNVTFTPGVNGDWAYPTIISKKLQVNDNNIIKVNEGSIHFNLQDFAKKDSNGQLSANNTYSKRVKLDFGDLGGKNVSDIKNSVSFLRGFRIDMNCDPNVQPTGEICNSNGVWPYFFNINLSNCSFQNPQSKSSQFFCDLNFNLDRAWTPALGGGKRFNYVMFYDVFIYYTIISSFNENTVFQSIPDKSNNNVDKLRFLMESSIQNKHALNKTFEISSSLSQTNNKNFDNGFVAFNSFSFYLPVTDNFIEQGRYIERLFYEIQDLSYNQVNQSMQYQFNVQYGAPHTVFPSKVVYDHTPSLIQYSSKYLNFQSPTNQKDSASVCINDKSSLFSCTLHGLPQRTTVKVHLK